MRELPWEVDPSSIEENFEACWRKMCENLKTPKYFRTTGGNKRFKAWSKDYRLFYEKSTGNICQLSKSDFKKAYKAFRKTGSLNSAKYNFTMHGSYIPPLLHKYFVKNKSSNKIETSKTQTRKRIK